MNCHGILSIIRFTKKDIFTYIDGFDEAGIMKYFFYFLKIATTLFFWGPIFIYLNNWTNLWAFHYHVFFVTFVHPHRKLLLSNIKTIEDKFSQDKRKSWLQKLDLKSIKLHRNFKRSSSTSPLLSTNNHLLIFVYYRRKEKIERVGSGIHSQWWKRLLKLLIRMPYWWEDR